MDQVSFGTTLLIKDDEMVIKCSRHRSIGIHKNHGRKPKSRKPLRESTVNGRLILKCILKEHDVRTTFIQLRIGPV
jgi:hypothetical protein